MSDVLLHFETRVPQKAKFRIFDFTLYISES